MWSCWLRLPGIAANPRLIASTGGAGGDFLKFNLEPGWTLMRRAYGTKTLGHIYVYRDSAQPR